MFKKCYILNYYTYVDYFIWFLIIMIRMANVSSMERTINPTEFCATVQECFEAGYSGHVICESYHCICAINTIFNKDIRGCYKKAYIGENCSYNYDCRTPKSICTNKINECNSEEKVRFKRCLCPKHHVFINNECFPIIDKQHGSHCCNTTECNDNFECLIHYENAYKTCQCPHFIHKNECYKHTDFCFGCNSCGLDKYCMKIQGELGICRESCPADQECFTKNCECDDNKNEIMFHNKCYNLKNLQLETNPSGELQAIKCPDNQNEIMFNNKCYNLKDLQLETNPSGQLQAIKCPEKKYPEKNCPPSIEMKRSNSSFIANNFTILLSLNIIQLYLNTN